MGLTLALHLVAAALIVAFLVGPVTVATLPGVLAEVWMAQLAYLPIAMGISALAGRGDITTGLAIGFGATGLLIPAACFGWYASMSSFALSN